MEFLKPVFNDKALTFDEFTAALEGRKDIKLVNLAEGKYVDKDKLDTANSTIKNLKETVAEFDGVDVEKLKNDAINWETKYNNDIAALKLNSALDSALMGAKARDVKAVKPFINMELIKLDGDKLMGFDEQIKSIKENKGFLFEDEKKPPFRTGMRQNGSEGTTDKKEEANAAFRSLFGKGEE